MIKLFLFIGIVGLMGCKDKEYRTQVMAPKYTFSLGGTSGYKSIRCKQAVGWNCGIKLTGCEDNREFYCITNMEMSP